MPTDVTAIHREHVGAFIQHLLDTTSASTAATRYSGFQQLFRWLTEEGEIESSPMARMQPPKLDEKKIPVIEADDLRKLLNTCSGRGFEERRDAAIIRLFIGTGARLSEVTNLRLERSRPRPHRGLGHRQGASGASSGAIPQGDPGTRSLPARTGAPQERGASVAVAGTKGSPHGLRDRADAPAAVSRRRDRRNPPCTSFATPSLIAG
jgi:integrase